MCGVHFLPGCISCGGGIDAIQVRTGPTLVHFDGDITGFCKPFDHVLNSALLHASASAKSANRWVAHAIIVAVICKGKHHKPFIRIECFAFPDY
jgi:hypothetical protein